MGRGPPLAFVDLASTLVPAIAAVSCFRRARAAPADLRRAWTLLGLATLSWSLGQAYWTAMELGRGEAPATPSLADAGYLLLIPFAALGVTALVRHPGGRRVDPRPLLDGGIVGASFIFAAFALGLERIVLQSAQSDAALTVNLLYPFGDALILGVVLLRLSRAPPRARGAIALLATGFTMLAVADLWFLVVDAQGVYSTGGILDAFWIIGFQLIGLAAVRPANLESAVDQPPQSQWLALVPLYPFLASTALATYAEIRDGMLTDTLFWTALVVVLLVLARLILMVFDNLALARGLQAERDLRLQMLNNVTHDLLSPLSAVRIQLKLLQGETLGPRSERQDRALHLVDRNVQRVLRLGGDLKDMGNLEGQRLSILPAPADLAAEARRALAAFEHEARERGVRLEADLPAEAPLHADAGRLGQVLDNLLSNALKFTPAGGLVRVEVSATAQEAVAAVADSGRGLTAEEVGRLFRPFSQVHQPGEVRERGTGLGLYISRGIAEGHGGSLTVTSAGHGAGSRFVLRLPVQARARAVADGLPLAPAETPPEGPSGGAPTDPSRATDAAP